MGPTWGPTGSCRLQMGPMLAPWTLLSGFSRNIASSAPGGKVHEWSLMSQVFIVRQHYAKITSIFRKNCRQNKQWFCGFNVIASRCECKHTRHPFEQYRSTCSVCTAPWQHIVRLVWYVIKTTHPLFLSRYRIWAGISLSSSHLRLRTKWQVNHVHVAESV